MLVTSLRRAELPPALDRSVLNNLAGRIQKNGAIVIFSVQLPIARSEWVALECAAKKFTYQTHSESQHCRVAELLTSDGGFRQACGPVTDIVHKPEMRELFDAAAGREVEPGAIRVLEMRMGGRIGARHPSFRAPIAMLRLESAYEGGTFFLAGNSPKDYDSPPHSLTLSRGDVPNGVRIVTNGTRKLLVVELRDL